MRRVDEGLIDIGVQVDHEILVLGNLGIAGLNLRGDPLLEGLTDDSRCKIQQKLAWQPIPLVLLGQMLEQAVVLGPELEDLVASDVVVEGREDVPDFINFHTLRRH